MYSDPEYVTRQYRDASKLNARIAPQVLDREPASRGEVRITKDSGLIVAGA